MTKIKQLIDERIHGKTIDEVSRLFFSKQAAVQEEEVADKYTALEEALTFFDQPPCMSYFQE